jgi:hypothetical protein
MLGPRIHPSLEFRADLASSIRRFPSAKNYISDPNTTSRAGGKATNFLEVLMRSIYLLLVPGNLLTHYEP